MARSGAPSGGVPAWLPLYLVVVLSVTLSPLLPLCIAHPPELRLDPLDATLNLMLFVPLGLALRARPVVHVIGLAAALALAIEVAQLWLPRISSPFDLVANALGAWVGWRSAAARVPHPLRGAGPARLALGVASLLVLVLLGTAEAPEHDFSNWQRFPLVLGNEISGDRPWQGVIREVAIYDRLVEPSEIATLRRSSDSRAWKAGGPILELELSAKPAEGGRPRAGATARLDGEEGPRVLQLEMPHGMGSSRNGDALGWKTGGTAWPLPAPLAAHLQAALVDAGELSLRARFAAGDLGATGPARIVTLSADPERRNLTLAQAGRNLELRVRTPHTGPNGLEPSLATHTEPLTKSESDVWGVSDGRRSRLYVDGSCEGDLLLTLERAPRVLGSEVALALLAAVLLPGLALAGWFEGTWRRRACVLGMGFLVSAWLLGTNTWSHLPGFASRAVLLVSLGLMACLPLVRRRKG